MSCIYVLRFAVAAVLLSLSGCLSAPPLHPGASDRPELRPEVFFAGRTNGTGELEARGRAPRSMRVEGFGRSEVDGTFRLDQTVTFADGAVETRTWLMRRVDSHAYTAS